MKTVKSRVICNMEIPYELGEAEKCHSRDGELVFGSIEGFKCRLTEKAVRSQKELFKLYLGADGSLPPRSRNISYHHLECQCERISPTGQIRKKRFDCFKLTFFKSKIMNELERVKKNPIIDSEEQEEQKDIIEINLPDDLIGISHPYESYILETVKGDFYITPEMLLTLLKRGESKLSGQLMRTRKHIIEV